MLSIGCCDADSCQPHFSNLRWPWNPGKQALIAWQIETSIIAPVFQQRPNLPSPSWFRAPVHFDKPDDQGWWVDGWIVVNPAGMDKVYTPSVEKQ